MYIGAFYNRGLICRLNNYLDLYEEVTQMFFEGWDIVVEVK